MFVSYEHNCIQFELNFVLFLVWCSYHQTKYPKKRASTGRAFWCLFISLMDTMTWQQQLPCQKDLFIASRQSR